MRDKKMIETVALDAFTDNTIAVTVDGYDIVHLAQLPDGTLLVSVHDFDADGDMRVLYSRKIRFKEAT